MNFIIRDTPFFMLIPNINKSYKLKELIMVAELKM